MSKKFLVTCTLLLSVLLLLGGIAQACWAYLTAEDLFNQSDLIAAGKIIGPADEFKEGALWMTNWQVRVDYVFSGRASSKELLVATPGADGKGMMSSIDYKLNAGGDYVLLFLREQDGRLEPLSPQGVIALKPTGKNVSMIKTGEDFLKAYQFTDSQSQDVEDIHHILSSTVVILPDDNTPSANLQTLVNSLLTRIVAFFRNLFA